MPGIRLAEAPLRFKLILTLLGAAVLLVSATTIISHRYWRDQSILTAEQQALLAAQTLHTILEPSLRYGRWEEARAQLAEIARRSHLASARVYDEAGGIVLSMDGDEGASSAGTRWIPRWSEIPEDGVVRLREGDPVALGYQRLHTTAQHVLEVGFPVSPVEAAMQRSARLGNTLLLASVIALGLILFLMVQREVLGPVSRLDRLLAAGPSNTRRSADELQRIEARVDRLLEEERELESKEGLAEVGQLAAEMAHEFKRPLASIFMALDLFRQEYELGDKEQTLLENMEGQLDRIDETMRDLLALARPLDVTLHPVDLPALINSTLVQLSPLIAAQGIEVHRNQLLGAPPVSGDARRLELAIANVMLNAVQAMPEGGRLELQVHANDEQIELQIHDTGVGMTDAQVQQALRPFYSTKADGTGLGLSLVARVVRAHRGQLRLMSRPGEGTVVTMVLPRADTVREEPLPAGSREMEDPS